MIGSVIGPAVDTSAGAEELGSAGASCEDIDVAGAKSVDIPSPVSAFPTFSIDLAAS